MSTDQSSPQIYPDHWLEEIVTSIDARNLKNISLATGKTPSGHIHMGILRELLICEALRRIYEKRGKKVVFRLFIDSLDAAKRFPESISKEYSNNNLGIPFALLPNPFESDGRNYARVFGEELASTFQELGINAEIVWTDQLYKTKRMKDMIRIGLKKNDQVKQIVAKYLTMSMTEDQKDDYIKDQETWMGAMVICEKCKCTQKKQSDGSIVPNRVISYHPEADECEYQCPACGYHGSVSIESGLVKLNWRLDWPAKWKLYMTACEPAGKDHCTPGGSYDTGLELCREIYHYQGPVKVPYEWLRLGDRDMKTSKGIVYTPKKFLEIADPEIIRMIIYRTNPSKHISIRIEEMEQYYNEFERLERIYYDQESCSPLEKKEIDYIYPLIRVNPVSDKCPLQIPFKFIMILTQLEPILGQQGILEKINNYLIREKKGRIESPDLIIQRLKKMSNWLEEIKEMMESESDIEIKKKIQEKVIVFSIVQEIPVDLLKQIDSQQIQVFQSFLAQIEPISDLTEENIKESMISVQKELNIKPMKLFQAFYLTLLGKPQGPRLGPLLAILGKNWIVKRLNEILLSIKRIISG